MQFSNIDSAAPQKVRISWQALHVPDDSGIDPESSCEGFWPSLDPDDAGYIGEASPSDIDGSEHRAEWERQHQAATERLEAFESGGWHYVGVVARATVFIPIGGNSFRVLTLDSAGLWGIESDSDSDYLRSVFDEERAELLNQLGTLAAALGQEPNFDEELPG